MKKQTANIIMYTSIIFTVTSVMGFPYLCNLLGLLNEITGILFIFWIVVNILVHIPLSEWVWDQVEDL